MLKLVAAILAVLLALPAVAADRVALVIGNGAYANATELPNPPNDATDIGAELERIGFTVILGTDLDRLGMEAKIREFVGAVRDAEIALFFYAGHGLQVDGKNFLVPVDAALEDAAALDFETIDADKVFGYMGGNDRVALAFLDACRDNPLSRSFARKTRSASTNQGLAAPQTVGTGLFIGFSTAPGDVALDGTGERNSPFTTALLNHLDEPGVEIQQLMTRVKADVRSATGDEQRPWHNSDLSTEVFLVPASAAVDIPEKTPQPEAGPAPDELIWGMVAESQVPAMFSEFIARFPDSVHRPDAEEKLLALTLAEQERARAEGRETTATDDVVWKVIETTASADQLKNFIEQFPGSAHRGAAEEKLVALQQTEPARSTPTKTDTAFDREAAIYRSALAQHDVFGYILYLREFPNGLFRTQAAGVAYDLAAAADNGQNPNPAERAFFDRAEASKDPVQFEAFVLRYPNGALTYEATARILGLLHANYWDEENAPTADLR